MSEQDITEFRQRFLEAYRKAAASSQPDDWMEAALLAKQYDIALQDQAYRGAARASDTGRSEAEAGWQTIATAPSDGRAVVIVRRGAKKPEVVPADGDWWRSTTCLGLEQRPLLWCDLPAISEAAARAALNPPAGQGEPETPHPPARGREASDG